MVSDQGLHCLPLSQKFLDKSMGSKIDLFIFFYQSVRLSVHHDIS